MTDFTKRHPDNPSEGHQKHDPGVKMPMRSLFYESAMEARNHRQAHHEGLRLQQRHNDGILDLAVAVSIIDVLASTYTSK